MKIIHTLDALKHESSPVYLAAGFFDGVHLGHHSVIGTAVEQARRANGQAWVMTFDTHPMHVLRPGHAPLMLTSVEHKLRLVQACGVDGCLLLPFTHELSRQSPEAFAALLFHSVPHLKGIVVGQNWRFGHKAAGTPELLARLGAAEQVGVITIDPVCHAGEPISSTRIRATITQGQLELAADMLGRPPSVLGTVVPGRQIGRQLGYPSANLDPHNEALPPHGIYAALAPLDGTLHEAVLNYGTSPTIDPSPEAPACLELHLLDYTGNLYGRELEAFFIAFLRREVRYPSRDLLKAAIAHDIDRARRILQDSTMAKKLKESLYRPSTTVL